MSGYCMQQRRADMGSARSAHPVFAGMLAVARNLRHNHSAGAPCAFPRGLFAIGTPRNDNDALHNEDDPLDCSSEERRVWQELVGACRYRWWLYYLKTKYSTTQRR